jgi:hypothetical protein
MGHIVLTIWGFDWELLEEKGQKLIRDSYRPAILGAFTDCETVSGCLYWTG